MFRQNRLHLSGNGRTTLIERDPPATCSARLPVALWSEPTRRLLRRSPHLSPSHPLTMRRTPQTPSPSPNPSSPTRTGPVFIPFATFSANYFLSYPRRPPAAPRACESVGASPCRENRSRAIHVQGRLSPCRRPAPAAPPSEPGDAISTPRTPIGSGSCSGQARRRASNPAIDASRMPRHSSVLGSAPHSTIRCHRTNSSGTRLVGRCRFESTEPSVALALTWRCAALRELA
jgi:hypothetical protein